VSQAPEDPNDRREYPRAPIELKVEYKRLNTFFADYTKNISQGGTFIKTTRPLGVGTRFLFKLMIPRLREPIAIEGEVRWVVREGEPPPPGIPEDHEPGMGIRFLYRHDDERRLVERTVERLMIDSLGQLLFSKLMGKDRGRVA
jgi:type IV pilus assembly protein PilZ